jgi:carbamate kinase
LKVVIALGGNAIENPRHEGVYAYEVRRIRLVARQILEIIREGHTVIITHGNGPQVGNLVLQQEGSAKAVPPQPLHVLDAMTQGQIGYLLQRELDSVLRTHGVKRHLVSVVTQVLVDARDQAFRKPTKPIGPFYDQAMARVLAKRRGYAIKRVKPVGDSPFRRVVPSPEPMGIVEGDLIAAIARTDAIVVASGGGGIPVARDGKGRLKGLDAVVDKDLTAEKLAEAVSADCLLVLTDVDRVMLNYGKPDQKPIVSMTLAEAKRYMAEGHFLEGSMAPKVLACMRFVEWGGRRGVISSLTKASSALAGRAGTQIVLD